MSGKKLYQVALSPLLRFLSSRNVNLDIKMKLERKAVYNVIGTINGKEEPGKLNVTSFGATAFVHLTCFFLNIFLRLQIVWCCLATIETRGHLEPQMRPAVQLL